MTRHETPPRPRLKTALFAALALGLSLTLIELGAQAIYAVSFGERYVPSHLLQLAPDRDPALLRAMERGSLPKARGGDVLHPFVGFVRDTAREESRNHGFPLAGDPIHRRGDDRLLVAVLGGSVAEQLADSLGSVLRDELTGSRRVPVVINLAMGGYKQPQQLLTLSYMMSLGAEFDVVINVDGFNELALSLDENHAHGVFPMFPRAWGTRISLEKSTKNFVLAGKIRYLRDRETAVARAAQQSPFRQSAIYGIVRRFQLTRLDREIAEAYFEVLDAGSSEYDFERDGPSLDAANRDEVLVAVADNWRNSSALLAGLVRAHGAEYYHVLQPNQYLPGSKTLSRDELSLSGYPRQAYAEIIPAGYRMLQDRGRSLRADGVWFHDATGVFAGESRTIYRDECCHYNDDGNRILARFVVERIRQETSLF